VFRVDSATGAWQGVSMTSPDDPDTPPASAGPPVAAGSPASAGSADAPAESGRSSITSAQVFKWAAAATAGVAVVLLVGAAVYAVRDILVLVLIAMFIAVSLDPAVRWLVRLGVRRSFAVATIFVGMLILVGIFVWSIAPTMVHQGGKLVADLPGFVRQLPEKSKTFREFSDRYNLTPKLTALAGELPARIGASALKFAQRFFGALISTLTVLVFTIYFMSDLPRLRRGLVRLFPRTRRVRVAEIVNVVVDKVGAYMIGNLIISAFAGVSSFICLELVRVPFALPLAVAVAITDLIPLIGATLGAALCVLVSAFTVDVWPGTVVVVAFFVVYQQVENYLIAPRVLRNTVDMPAVGVLLVALIGGTVLGVVGALMAIPIAAAVKVVLSPALAAMHEPPQPVEAVREAPAETVPPGPPGVPAKS
jgi:predicted PurR-regulated permease PerM